MGMVEIRKAWPRITAPALTDAAWAVFDAYVDHWRRNNRAFFFSAATGGDVRDVFVVTGLIGKSWSEPRAVNYGSNREGQRFTHALWLDANGRPHRTTLAMDPDIEPIDPAFTNMVITAIGEQPERPDIFSVGRHQENPWIKEWTLKCIRQTLGWLFNNDHIKPNLRCLESLMESELIRSTWESERAEKLSLAKQRLAQFHCSEEFVDSMKQGPEYPRYSLVRKKEQRYEADITRWRTWSGTLQGYAARRLVSAVEFAGTRQAQKFLASLDRRLLSAAATAEAYDFSGLEWLATPSDDRSRLYRCQAIQSYPTMVPRLTSLAEEIDAGQDPTRLLALSYGVKPATVRVFRNWRRNVCGRLKALVLPDSVLNSMTGATLDQVVQAFDLLPIDWLPRRADQWSQLDETLEIIKNKPAQFIADILRRCRNKAGFHPFSTDILDFLSRVELQLLRPLAWRCVEERRPGALMDILAENKTSMLPSWHEVDPYRTNTLDRRCFPLAMRLIAGDTKIRQLEELSKLWHRQHMDATDALANILPPWFGSDGPQNANPLVPWAVPKDWMDGGSATAVVALATPDELAEEGKALHHCVGGYVPACISGSSVILSLRTGHGEQQIRSTVELAFNAKGRVSVRQHRGPQNGRPHPKHGEALQRYLKAELGSAAQREALANALDRQANLASRYRDGQPALCFDPMDDHACGAAFEVWRFALPHALRDLHWKDWIVGSGLSKIVMPDPIMEIASP